MNRSERHAREQATVERYTGVVRKAPAKPCREDFYGSSLVLLPDYDAQGPYPDQAWRFDVGAYGDHSLIVWARGVEDALEKCADFTARYWPGLMTEPDYEDAKKEWLSEHPGEDPESEEAENEIQEAAEVDLTYTESGWIASWEWWIGERDREQLLSEINDALNSGKDVVVCT